MHQRSVSPNGKFGFHFATCHARIAQAVDVWEDSWCALYSRHLGHVMELAKPILKWPEFDVVCRLTLEKVVPRLLLPLQSEGRSLKPCLIHGDCWDGNTAMDARTGEAFVFDVCSFYGHNEYDTGNWRAPRHRLSNKAYIRNYKKHFPVSEPVEDWDARNLLYSLTFNIGNTIYIPGSQQRQVSVLMIAMTPGNWLTDCRVYDDMTTLCKMFCPQEYVPFTYIECAHRCMFTY
jgi:protein-ribulosamine 3-kinase